MLTNKKSKENFTFSVISLSINELIDSDFHIGHTFKTLDRLNFKFILYKRINNLFFNLNFTLYNLRLSLFFLTNLVSRRGKILFVDNSNDTYSLLKFFSLYTHQYFVNQKWIGGILTNFRYFYIAVILGISKHFKIDISSFDFQGLRFINRTPNLVIFLNRENSLISFKETFRLGIPNICLLSSHLPLHGITFPLFCNLNNNISSVSKSMELFSTSILNGYRLEIIKFNRISLKKILIKRINSFFILKKMGNFLFFFFKKTILNNFKLVYIWLFRFSLLIDFKNPIFTSFYKICDFFFNKLPFTLIGFSFFFPLFSSQNTSVFNVKIKLFLKKIFSMPNIRFLTFIRFFNVYFFFLGSLFYKTSKFLFRRARIKKKYLPFKFLVWRVLNFRIRKLFRLFFKFYFKDVRKKDKVLELIEYDYFNFRFKFFLPQNPKVISYLFKRQKKKYEFYNEKGKFVKFHQSFYRFSAFSNFLNFKLSLFYTKFLNLNQNFKLSNFAFKNHFLFRFSKLNSFNSFSLFLNKINKNNKTNLLFFIRDKNRNYLKKFRKCYLKNIKKNIKTKYFIFLFRRYFKQNNIKLIKSKRSRRSYKKKKLKRRIYTKRYLKFLKKKLKNRLLKDPVFRRGFFRRQFFKRQFFRRQFFKRRFFKRRFFKKRFFKRRFFFRFPYYRFSSKNLLFFKRLRPQSFFFHFLRKFITYNSFSLKKKNTTINLKFREFLKNINFRKFIHLFEFLVNLFNNNKFREDELFSSLKKKRNRIIFLHNFWYFKTIFSSLYLNTQIKYLRLLKYKLYKEKNKQKNNLIKKKQNYIFVKKYNMFFFFIFLFNIKFNFRIVSSLLK